ncbi:Spore germination protein GerE [Geobacillus sp. BCO2]|nr:Spore germination protein GerE [Geobacillus sp. BCO2]
MKDKSFQSKPLLTKREKEVFELLVQDKTTKEIAKELFISEKTVRNHISNAMQKLGVKGARKLSLNCFEWANLNYNDAGFPCWTAGCYVPLRPDEAWRPSGLRPRRPPHFFLLILFFSVVK